MTFNSGENTRFEDIDISIDGERVALVAYELINIAGADGRGQTPLRTEPILVKAGQHKVAAAFVKKIDGPYEDLIRPHDWSYAGGGSGGAGITTLPHMGDLVIRGPIKTTGISTTPEPPEDVHLPADLVGERARLREADHREDRRRSVSPAGDAAGSRSPDAVLRGRRGEGRLRDGRALGARSGARQPALHLPPRESADRCALGRHVSRRRHRPGLAAVVLHLGPAAGSGSDRRRRTPRAVDAGRPREARAPHARRSARRRAGRSLRGAVAAPAGHRQGPSRSELLSELRREPRRRDAHRDEAVLQQPGQGRSQRARAADRRLHVPQRAARAPLRHPRASSATSSAA